jgi:hypothetical protein
VFLSQAISWSWISRRAANEFGAADGNAWGELDSGGATIGKAAKQVSVTQLVVKQMLVKGHGVSSAQASPNLTSIRIFEEITPWQKGPGEGIHFDTDMVGCWSLTKRSSNPIREGVVISGGPLPRQ